jgi:hypothetical protein
MIVAKPANWDVGDPNRITTLIDTFVANPRFATYPWPDDIRRTHAVQTLGNPGNLVFEAWKDGQFCGILLLEHIIPFVDASFHFLFVDHDLVGKRALIVNFLGTCFRDMGFHRLSMEVPDFPNKERRRRQESSLLRFLRDSLGFRYEGEERARSKELSDVLSNEWVAKQGSRRSQAHFDGETWRDIVLLRLLASEWESKFGGS